MRAFLCHSSEDSEFVIEVAKLLQRNFEDGAFYYEEDQRSEQGFLETINLELERCEAMVVFVGNRFSRYQVEEANTAHDFVVRRNHRHIFVVLLPNQENLPAEISMLGCYPRRSIQRRGEKEALDVAYWIVNSLDRSWLSADDLPFNPHLFSYEKDIIRYFVDKRLLGDRIFKGANVPPEMKDAVSQVRQKWLEGCPATWPRVVRWENQETKRHVDELIEAERNGDAQTVELLRNYETWKGLGETAVGKWRRDDAFVVTAALSDFHKLHESETSRAKLCMMRDRLFFPEAGPRSTLYFPGRNRTLKVAVLVSGGIAPGINAVIDGITQRHHLYGQARGYVPEVLGLQNGFLAFGDLDYSSIHLSDRPDRYGALQQLVTSERANEGGSMLGTSRTPELIDVESRLERLGNIADQLFDRQVEILYVIGGDGSMKAAHALWAIAQARGRERVPPRRPLSVVAVPKTMDNDILWVWQAFGFLSAVEKAREVVAALATEVTSNPRLCVVQLFGSDSGFVVSHTVLASRSGHCDAALIPEVPFSMKGLAAWLRYRISKEQRRVPHGLVVMAETAVPIDAIDFLDDADIALSDEEKRAIREFEKLRASGLRIEGQTEDALRSTGLKIVSRGLKKMLPCQNLCLGEKYQPPPLGPVAEPQWELLRVVTNEPRHLLRAIAPSCSDIINGHRLGTLAVDNAMAGYTDFMISQWLTEYVLVPLRLVALGRKRIPDTGIFWKSVLAKTGQPAEMV